MHRRICRHHPPVLRRLVVLEREPDRGRGESDRAQWQNAHPGLSCPLTADPGSPAAIRVSETGTASLVFSSVGRELLKGN